MTDQTQVDPWATAETAKEPPKRFFGQVLINVWFCILQKGVGKVPFDPQQHKQGQRRTAVDVEIVPLPESGLQFTLERNMVAETREWASTVLPSLKALGVSIREVHEKWAQVELVPSRTYIDRNTGEEKQATVPKFIAVYDTEDECQAAADELFNGGEEEDEPSIPATDNGGANPEKEVALKFLPALVAQAQGDPDRLAGLLANQPLVSKYFSVDSPEVTEAVQMFQAQAA